MQVPQLAQALLQDWVLYLTLGLTVGGVMNILSPEKSYGIFVDCATGLVGSIAGGCLAWAWNDYFRPGSFALILSSLGAFVFIAVLRKIHK
jgi:uncharacterized membrane protein YeaQ/YmgE (transglycosylase-associated protein family)